jgi:1-acyl-sn-glycerol-3-phosphate acyltransferase
MGALSIASKIFELRPWVVWVVAALYVVPALRLVTFPFSLGHPFFMFFNKRLGELEHGVSWFRDTVVVVYLAAAALWNISFGINRGENETIAAGLAALALIALSIANRSWKLSARKRLIDFVRRFPTIHPEEFFSQLLCCSGGVRPALPKGPRRLIDPAHLDFRTHKGTTIPPANYVAGVWSTIWCARLSLLALKWKGSDFLREVASALALIWGTRMAELSRAEVIVGEAAKLKETHGLNIYLFNHMSFLDFAMVPVAIAAFNSPSRRAGEGKGEGNCLPRFLIAKDHFLDNPVFHTILGIGRVAEATGMVFVDRKEKEADARAVVEESAVKLVRDGVDFAIFPQGTRAVGKVAANGERMDAGYYTVGRPARMKRDGDHMKKGAAHLATCAAIILNEESVDADVNLVPVAIKGTSIIAPRGSMRMRSNVTVRLDVGDPIVIKPSEVKGVGDNTGKVYADFVKRLHERVDHELKSAVGIHAELERRFFEDMRMVAEPLDIEEMAIAMKPWRGDDYLVHAILDCIYACEPNDWYPLLGRLMYLIRNDAPRNEFLAFKGEVIDKIGT